MGIPPTSMGDVGKMKYHLVCPYHGEVAVVENQDEAFKESKAHILARHTDRDKKVAPGAEVIIEMKRHFLAADLDSVQDPQS